MSSDIDIEEHDVFEHPTIKKNFPDISKIKTEVIELDSEDASECHSTSEPVFPTTSETDQDCFDNHDRTSTDNLLTPVKSQNKIILGSKVMPNKIILGSKPKKQEKDPYSVQVILKDWNYILDNHPFYCKECLILFPTQNTLDAHGMLVHSLLVVKDEIDVHISHTNSLQVGAHELLVKCPICSYYFKTLRYFRIHSQKQHNSLTIKPIYDSFRGTCMFCLNIYATLPSYSKHIYYRHFDKYKKQINDAPGTADANISNTSGHFGKVYFNKAKKSTSKTYNQIAKKSTAKNNTAAFINSEIKQNFARKSTAKLDSTFKDESLIEGSPRKSTDDDSVAVVNKSNNKALKSTAKSSLDGSVEVEEGGLELFKCPICGLYFKYVNRYVKHCQASHQALYLTPKREPFNGLCFCGYKAHDYVAFSKHLSRTHIDIYRKKATDIQEYSCLECDLTFTTANSLHIHKIAKHNENSDLPETVQVKTEVESCRPKRNSVKTAQSAQVSSSLKHNSPQEARTNAKIGNLNAKKAKIDYDSDDYLTDSIQSIVIVPKEIIFKCPTCCIHFVSSRTAYFHLIQCLGSSPDSFCKICNLGFKSWEKKSHRLQHHLFNNIKVIEMNQELYWSLVFVCGDCKVGFDGRFVANHIDCDHTNSTNCSECNINIDDLSAPNHRKMHGKHVKPFIIELRRGNLNDLKSSKPIADDSKNVLYYCNICKSYDPKVQSDQHKKGFCDSDKIFRICRFCGLRFSQASYPAHIESHNDEYDKLSDVKFIDMHTGETIKPKIPDWTECGERCKIKYSREKRKHQCFEEKSVYCTICKETFNEMAYKIHLQYHEYEVPNDIDAEIMEKYSIMLSLWNIMYRCQDCDILFDNYDLAIEHSQDYFGEGRCEISQEKCTKCDLTFAKAVFDRHKVLHDGAEIDTDSFHILNFNPNDLLNDSWYDIFKPISEEQKSHILAKSVYNYQRGLRLELIVDGPPVNTLYKCATCDAIVDSPSIVDHANNRNLCTTAKRVLNCSICKLSFLTIQSLSDHKTLHSDSEYKTRILMFNRPEHFEVNDQVLKVLRKESLKFNWCQQCSVLIKKDKFEAHMLSHGAEREVFGVIPRSNLLYKCVTCEAGLATKRSLSLHRCLPNRCYSKCKYCKLLFPPSVLKRHYLLHKSMSKYHIALFKNGAVLKRGQTKTVTLYQCTKCKVCTQDRYRLRGHVCVPLSMQTTCALCKYNFRARTLNKHMTLHTRIPNITRDNVDVVHYTPDSDNKKSHKRIVYKCDCNLLFIKQDKLLAHKAICSRDAFARECKCGLTFHERSLQDHLQLHDNCCNVQTYILVNIKIGKGATDGSRHWLWVCATCNLHSVYLNGLNCHVRHEERIISHSKKLCQICKVYFSSDTLGAHIKWHHKASTCNLADFHKKYVRNVSAKDLTFKCLNRKIGDDKAISDFQVGELKTNRVCDKNRPVLYTCKKCDLYFTTDRQFDYHFQAAKHNSAKTRCKFCTFFFTTRIIDVHVRLHHSKPNFRANDFIIKTHTENYTQNIRNPKPTRQPTVDTKPVQKLLQKNYANLLKIPSTKKKFLCKSIANTPLDLLKTIYQCGSCQLNTVISKTMDSHMTRSTCGFNGYKRHSCPQCGLSFTIKSLARHYFIHHTKLNLKLEDFNIRITYKENKYTKTRPNKELSETETVKQPNKPTPVEVKTIKTLVVNADNAKPKPIADNLIPTPLLVRPKYAKKPSAADHRASTAIEPKHTAISNKTVDFNENAPRLFKCGDCDVYFATYDMCYDHTLKHKPLDPTEFIACKVCDLQIVCECLGVHMRGHREGTFYIDDLVVTEFRPRDGVPFVETYLAAELLESNLISTTTNCGE